jgi:hypothetical protein
MKKLIKQEWAIGEGITVTFESYLDEEGCTVTFAMGGNTMTFEPDEGEELKSIFESTNFIFKQ